MILLLSNISLQQMAHPVRSRKSICPASLNEHSASTRTVRRMLTFRTSRLHPHKSKTLQDAISDVSWRDGAERFVIFVEDEYQNYMTPGADTEDPNSYAELLSSLLDSNIHLNCLWDLIPTLLSSMHFCHSSMKKACTIRIIHLLRRWIRRKNSSARS